MILSDFLTIGVFYTGVTAIAGWWVKSRLETSIKHEYDRLLEAFKTEQKRSEVLHIERLSTFKELSTKLIALRRYCRARIAEIQDESEFESRTDSLPSSENKSLLSHYEVINEYLDERELFISIQSREQFNDLFHQMALGFNMEKYLAGGMSSTKINAHDLYELVVDCVDSILESLYTDLGFPPE